MMGFFKECQCGKKITGLSKMCTECFFKTHDVMPKQDHALMLHSQLDIRQQFESLYNEIGKRCPYDLAEHFGITLITEKLWDDNCCGAYKSTPNKSIFYIYLNSKTGIETQETTCYLLLTQHITCRGEDMMIMKEDLWSFQREAEKAAKKYLTVLTESFLSHSRTTMHKA